MCGFSEFISVISEALRNIAQTQQRYYEFISNRILRIFVSAFGINDRITRETPSYDGIHARLN